ncbi:DUF2075 domain-containing protein [Asticcacaulis excentricus]|uniref:Schlafen group 3-like DNA/RNA helicase domain-containing protein n=1 Tax=Asticcacaulis excentricus TaxID=78587 RepID=A0A3G9GAJ3_9CAUL|nr:DUF2075 domain-containing protein [Asticcacaulis excentricus]BBF81499.1 hypothetical protein EM6_2100 [Asticcacaulis excentricus]
MHAYYTADREKFFSNSDDQILGELARANTFALDLEQKGAWLQQIRILRNALTAIDVFTLYFEFTIPRMGKRADAVVVIGDCIFIIEFKVGSEGFDRHAIEQVEDYALDLKNFHAGSHHLSIVPILVATRAKTSPMSQPELALDQVSKPLLSNVIDLGDILRHSAAQHRHRQLDVAQWASSGYRPTPTIIEAARALYARHDVRDIARSDVDAINLSRTQDFIAAVIEDAKSHQRKTVCFVTGVPGAGKTLAGLNIATQRSESHADEHATFLSGNGPLVDVLREALARDQSARTGRSKKHVERDVRAFIQNIHHFRDDYAGSATIPSEHVVVFDEAQRAWTRAQASKFMQAKRGMADFDMSEPEFLLSVMDRHPDWCTVVCLIGGGQEINTGEAGLSEWMAAIRARFPHWRVYASAQIVQPDYDLNHDARHFIQQDQVTLSDDLHLGVSMRSFRAETLSGFVAHLLNGEAEAARTAFAQLTAYPIVITRDLNAARRWLRCKARGTERYGLVASSGAYRLKPEGLHVKASIEPANWFLNDREDVRSSWYLEDVATEFDVQGLELDWVGVCWDADYRYSDDGWQHHKFAGTKWRHVNDAFAQLYLKNAYRVILTRARQGMVIFVPKGDADDPTRPPGFYDATYAFLKACGLQNL